uniref:Uncharacterized protein n=1 Tax=Picea glauca TaxID=3330 RepID=A0A101M019_PICGL|nr:hypothetical protein ABT39_MTgene4505 [Picea glauca]QHR87419.1 hypothetical protein Q903MT_gene1429 [Picea sitchensis]
MDQSVDPVDSSVSMPTDPPNVHPQPHDISDPLKVNNGSRIKHVPRYRYTATTVAFYTP